VLVRILVNKKIWEKKKPVSYLWISDTRRRYQYSTSDEHTCIQKDLREKTLFPTCEYQTLVAGDFRLGHHSQTVEKQVKKDWRSRLHGENSKESMVPNWPARLLNRPYRNPFGVQWFWVKLIFLKKIKNLLTMYFVRMWLFMMKRRKEESCS
jgi:hypothetical protein